MPKMKMPPAVLMILTLGPALAIGMTLWLVNDLFPECVVTEQGRLPSPDGQFDLTTFSRHCGSTTTANIQAALVPPGEDVPFDAASFVSVGTDAGLQPLWTTDGDISITIPQGVDIYRQDETVAGITVIYR